MSIVFVLCDCAVVAYLFFVRSREHSRTRKTLADS